MKKYNFNAGPSILPREVIEQTAAACLDFDNDRNAGKRTLVVMIGRKYAEWLYISLPTLALVAVLFQYGWSEKNMLLCFCVYFLFVQSWNEMRMIKSGRALNKILGKTARNIFLFGILISLLIIFS